jgi:hypothetical protein
MPKKAHKALIKAADKKGLTGERRKAFIFGRLAKIEQAKSGKKGKK